MFIRRLAHTSVHTRPFSMLCAQHTLTWILSITVYIDQMNKALAQLQRERPSTTVSYTLMVQAEDYGLTPGLGVDLLKNAAANNVRVDIVNAMAMEFWATSADWGKKREHAFLPLSA